MYQHHQQSLEKAIAYFTEISDKKDDIIAIILGGSVAKGCERVDSDLDFMIVVTDERYQQLEQKRQTVETIGGYCTYPEGYFDTKYYPKAFLEQVAQKGSEPARNAFFNVKCVYTKDPTIPAMIEAISRFPTELKEEKMLSFYAALSLNMGYFWDMSKHDIFLRTKAASEIVLYGLRLLLQQQEVLFPCAKSLYQTVQRLEHKPEGILQKANALLINRDDQSKQDFVDTLLTFLDYHPPEEVILTQYVKDHEHWWNEPRPVIAEW